MAKIKGHWIGLYNLLEPCFHKNYGPYPVACQTNHVIKCNINQNSNGQIKRSLNRPIQPIGTMFFLKNTNHIVSYVIRINIKMKQKSKFKWPNADPWIGWYNPFQDHLFPEKYRSHRIECQTNCVGKTKQK
jgi:hypothetical protein